MTNNVSDITYVSSLQAPDSLDIIFRLKRLGLTQTKLAADLSVTPSIINNVIHGRATCFSVANHIAVLLDTTVQTLWPDRYVFKPRASRTTKSEDIDKNSGGIPMT